MTNPKVDRYLTRAGRWQEPMEHLRRIALDLGMEEELKWGQPCFRSGGKNVAILQGFRDFCAIMFFKGVLLADPDGALQGPGEHSHAARRMVFDGVEQVRIAEPALRRLLAEAIRVEDEGRKVPARASKEPAPEELLEMFDEVPGLRHAFEELTPGRQRAYLLHFSDAKRPATRRARIEKHAPRILVGKGLHDR